MKLYSHDLYIHTGFECLGISARSSFVVILCLTISIHRVSTDIQILGVIIMVVSCCRRCPYCKQRPCTASTTLSWNLETRNLKPWEDLLSPNKGKRLKFQPESSVCCRNTVVSPRTEDQGTGIRERNIDVSPRPALNEQLNAGQTFIGRLGDSRESRGAGG